IARECALAGARTLLLEQKDFASGTTSRATRIIHGGLRYLEHGELDLVRESLRERERLLRERPHLVRSLHFVLALRGDSEHGLLRSGLAVRAGLWLYRRMAGRRPDSSSASTRELERMLDSGAHWNLFSYDDGQCEFPERLVAEWLTEAVQAGAVARNHTRVLEVERAHGRVSGVRARDLSSGREFTVGVQQVVNATGPWVDGVLGDSGITHPPLIAGVRGSHIVLPTFAGAPQAAIYSEASDRRAVFVLPWNGMLLVGTTEVPDSRDPGRVRPEAEEIEYLLAAFNALLPSYRATRRDIIYSYAGVRPLPHVDDLELSAITRRHLLYEHDLEGASGMLSIVGGKLTTAGSLARQCARALKLSVAEPTRTLVAAAPANGIEATLWQWSRLVAAIAGISEASAAAMAEWHGRNALCIAREAQRDELLRKTLCPHTEHIVAEAVNAVTREQAMNAADVLLRRVPVALGGCWSEECSRIAVERVGAALAWGAARRAQELEALEVERGAFLIRPQRTGPELLVPQSTAQ
ncbi:MAG TPA: glycerol-3-phosphate dehydrogenase/oxidase, partial [Terriglobales bacterium]|nr:glycerol-3-phosphate dehydrogenase/oxidase [Terriglobales bacterium]